MNMVRTAESPLRSDVKPLAPRQKSNATRLLETSNASPTRNPASTAPVVAPRSFAPTAEGDGERVPPLVIQIAQGLMQDIVTGRYQAGTWIREQEVASRFESSRAPVREALRLIEIDGLIEMVPWRGARVVELSLDEIDDLFVLVAALMAVVARFAALHASDKDIKDFQARVKAMEETIAKGHPAGEQLSIAFAAAAFLGQICGSPRAAWMFRRVGNLAYWKHQALQHAGIAWRRSSLEKWRRLASALTARDAPKAEALTQRLVKQSHDFVMAYLRAERDATVAKLNGSRRTSTQAK